MDRYGRALAHLFMAYGIWVQGEMLKNGMDAYTGYTAMTMNNQSYVVRLIAIQHSAFSK
jgi:endonuclease YncB( thermonuclease family)